MSEEYPSMDSHLSVQNIPKVTFDFHGVTLRLEKDWDGSVVISVADGSGETPQVSHIHIHGLSWLAMLFPRRE